MTARRWTVGIAMLAVALGACGGDADDTLSARAEARLAPLSEQVRARAGAFDPDGARTALAELRRVVTELSDAGRLGDERAAVILTAAAEVERRLVLAPTTTTTTTTTTTAPPVPSTDDDDGDQHGGDGKGKPKDEGKTKGGGPDSDD